MKYLHKTIFIFISIVINASTFAADDIPRSLGNGFPGVLNKPKLQQEFNTALESAGALIYSYTRSELPEESQKIVAINCPTNSISFIAHQPKKLGMRMLPLIVEFKIVPDNFLSPSMINTNLFNAIKTEKLTEFAKKDFVAMSILVPKSLKLSSSSKGERTEPAKLAMDAIMFYSKQIGNRTINTNQIFVVAEDPNSIDSAFDFYLQYPNRFTLFLAKNGVPSSSILNNISTPPNKISIYHSNKVGIDFKQKADSFRFRIEKLDGKFELLSYDSSLQNNWDNPELIKWLLTHTTDGAGIGKNKKVKYDPKNPSFIDGIKCSTSEDILPQKKSWPAAAVDGDEKTYFQSANMVKKGGWWMAEYESPIKGKVTIKCGTKKRNKLDNIYGNMRVEISADGVKWQQRGSISKEDGEFSYIENSGKIKFIRVISYSQKEIMLIVREVSIEER